MYIVGWIDGHHAPYIEKTYWKDITFGKTYIYIERDTNVLEIHNILKKDILEGL